MKHFWIALVLMMCGSTIASAELHIEHVEYQHGDVLLEGYLAYDTALQSKRPGILVVHEWMGLSPYTKRRADQLAQLGYVAFAADMYGKGVHAKDHEEAGRLSGTYRNDRQLMRARIRAAYDVLANHELVDPSRIGAIGYCFGGTTVLELARSGADVKGVVSFHGALNTPNPADANNIKGKVLVLHGADDTFVPPAQVDAFRKEMDEAVVSYRLIAYPGAVHSFTVLEAGSDPSTGVAYHAQADQQSWDAMTAFFAELFADRSLHE